jgi:hypothetical protein
MKVTLLDLREDFRAGLHPCDKIQNALSAVGKDEALRLLVPFEPLPLFEVATSKGLGHHASQTADGDWEVIFSPSLAVPAPNTAACPVSCGCEPSAGTTLDIDARGLEPPQPMVKILEALAMLPQGAGLRARTDRRPVHLYPILQSRGFTGKSEEQSDGSFLTHITRA